MFSSLLSSRASSNKRPRDAEENSDSPQAKRRKRLHPSAALADVQAEIQYLEERCAAEQIQKQQQYDAKKKPLLVKRALALRDIPFFWRTVITVLHKVADCQPFYSEEELGLLGYLTEIFVEENVDENGYSIFV